MSSQVPDNLLSNLLILDAIKILIEDGMLTLATGNGDEVAPRGFEATEDTGLNRYPLRKVHHKKGWIEADWTLW